MKAIIQGTAVIALIIIIIAELSVFFLAQGIKHEVREIIYSHVDSSRQEGYFTNARENQMLAELANVARCNVGDIVITKLTRTPKYRTEVYDNRELIEYDISVPYNLFIGHRVYTTVEGHTPSELLD